MDSRIRVLHIITNLPVGGAQDNTLLTVERLNRDKYHLTLLCANDGLWVRRAKMIKNLDLIFVNQLRRKIHLTKDFMAFWKIYQILRKGQYNIVHTHSSKPGVLGRLAAKLAGVPIVVHTIHGFPFNDFMNPIIQKFYIMAERLLSKLSDKLITVSNLNLQKALRLRFAPVGKFVNIYSGIDFRRFDSPTDIRKKKKDLGIANGDKVVGMIGRLSKQKAPLDFIQAMGKVLTKRQDVQILLVGDGELKAETLALSKQLNIDSRLKILGFRDDVPELLHLIDIFVLTSWWEGLGRSLTEAMYTARPVVATDVDGVPELVEDGRTGLLVQPNDIQAIAEGVLHLLENEGEAEELGQNAAKRINEAFRADVMVGYLDRLYQELLSKKGIKYHSIAHKQRKTSAVRR